MFEPALPAEGGSNIEMEAIMTAITFNIAPAANTRLRLTRRGRAVLGTLAALPLIFGLAVFGFSNSPASAGDASTSTGQLSYVTVANGESLWSIAESVAPSRDPRDVVADIVKLNGLSSANVPAGTSIALPNY